MREVAPIVPLYEQPSDRAPALAAAAAQAALRSAEEELAACVQRGAPPETLARREVALAEECRKRSHFARARDLCASASARIGELPPSGTHAYLQIILSRLAWDASDYTDALSRARSALDMYTELGDEEGTALSNAEAGKACIRLKDSRAARDYYHDALATYRRRNDQHRMASAHNNLGIIYKNCGDWVRAIEHLEEALRLDRAANELELLPVYRLNIGIVHLKMGAWEAASENLEAARAMAKGSENYLLLADCLLALGNYNRFANRPREADRLYAQALDVARRYGYRRQMALAHEFRGDVAWDAQNAEAALAEYHEAFQLAEETAPDGDITAEVCRRLADVHVSAQEYAPAAEYIARALSIAQARGDAYEEGAAQRIRGLLLHSGGQHGEALDALARSAQLLRSISERYELAKTLYDTGRVLRLGPPGGRERAWRLFKEASYHFEDLGVRDWVGRVDRELLEFRADSDATNGKRRAADHADVREKARQFEAFGIVTQSSLMVDVLEMVQKAARSRFCILIQGETGTGKERLARAIHEMGALPSDKFVALNCNGLPEGLQESELFGHKRGAFTGAQSDKPGLFELADGGTLFLDEVTDLTAGAQGKILRIIEDGQLRRLGDVRSSRINVRILAATNKPAIDEVRAGRFRKDLFYRLSVFPVNLPPLRDRPEDVALLAQFFMARESAAERKPVSLASDAVEALTQYEWPGNVRELENLICRLYVLAEPDSAIHAHDLPPEMLANPAHPASAFGLKERLEMFERDHIERALKACGGDRVQTAAILGITRRWLSEKMRRYNLDRAGTIVPQ